MTSEVKIDASPPFKMESYASKPITPDDEFSQFRKEFLESYGSASKQEELILFVWELVQQRDDLDDKVDDLEERVKSMNPVEVIRTAWMEALSDKDRFHCQVEAARADLLANLSASADKDKEIADLRKQLKDLRGEQSTRLNDLETKLLGAFKAFNDAGETIRGNVETMIAQTKTIDQQTHVISMQTKAIQDQNDSIVTLRTLHRELSAANKHAEEIIFRQGNTIADRDKEIRGLNEELVKLRDQLSPNNVDDRARALSDKEIFTLRAELSQVRLVAEKLEREWKKTTSSPAK